MKPTNAKEIINSVGIEMEFMNINKDSQDFKESIRHQLAEYKILHDASCESLEDQFLGKKIVFGNKRSKKVFKNLINSIVIGGEIISPIRNTLSPIWMTEIERLCEILKAHGEKEDTTRDSFHVHVNLSKEVPLFVLKNILKLTLKYEAFLYRLGGMGRMNRGIVNDFMFARPYTPNGPPVIKYNNQNYPILNANTMLQAETKEDFFGAYGDSYVPIETKYVTQRYMNVNFYPVLSQGSIEFRTANKTLNPEYIIAWTNFCKALVTAAFSSSDIPIERIYTLASNTDISLAEFQYEINQLPIDKETIFILSQIWESSPTPHFDNKWRYSHLREPTGFTHANYMTEPLNKKIKVENANVIDLHRLENQREGRDF